MRSVTEPHDTEARDDLPEAVLEVEGVAKSFGPTMALVNADLALYRGEILALMGENGSGKSTLVKILSGVHSPDRGTVRRPRGTATLRSPRQAIDSGTVAVFQEILVVPGRSLVDNVWLGSGGFFRSARPEPQKRAIAGQLLEDLLGASPDLDMPAGALSVAHQQACCIARALVREPEVLILDESTSALDVETRDRLFKIVRSRCATGMSAIFISHRMDEITAFVDRAVVLRSGHTVGTVQRADINADALVRLMTGAEHLVQDAALHHENVSVTARQYGEPRLTVSALRLTSSSAPIDLEVRAGEIVGLAGLEGHGQDMFLDVVAKGSSTAEIAVATSDGCRRIRSRRDGRTAGLALVPRDRRGEGIFPALSTLENFAAATLVADRRMGLLSAGSARKRLERFVSLLHINAGSLTSPITTLSGGNQQKVVIARWLAAAPRVLLLSDPTRGIDLGAKRDIYAVLRRLADDGLAVVMLSSEVDELIELMDRVVVFREHTLFGELSGGELTRERLVASFFGRDMSSRAVQRSTVDASREAADA
jgi:ABC-type sugar transport system ATPase subunit